MSVFILFSREKEYIRHEFAILDSKGDPITYKLTGCDLHESVKTAAALFLAAISLPLRAVTGPLLPGATLPSAVMLL